MPKLQNIVELKHNFGKFDKNRQFHEKDISGPVSQPQNREIGWCLHISSELT